MLKTIKCGSFCPLASKVRRAGIRGGIRSWRCEINALVIVDTTLVPDAALTGYGI